MTALSDLSPQSSQTEQLMVMLRGHFRPDQPRQAGLTQHLSELRGAQFPPARSGRPFLQPFQQHLLSRKKVCNGCHRDLTASTAFSRERLLDPINCRMTSVLDLDPIRRPATAIDALPALGHQALQSEFAGLPK